MARSRRWRVGGTILGWSGIILVVLFLGCGPRPVPYAVIPEPAPPVVKVEPEGPPRLPVVEDGRLARLDAVGRQEVSAGHVPGAVILVGHKGKIVYRKAFGMRVITPQAIPMTVDTVFDLASLTKVVATAPAVMKLVETGRIKLDDPVAKYWPAFGGNGKGRITIRQLMTHTSGLRADVSGRSPWSGYEGAMAVICADRPLNPPGSAFRYSDMNFIVLGEIVRRVTVLPLDVYCAQEIFKPLGMRDTTFHMSKVLAGRSAPTDVRWGEVHDPIAYRMGGVAGNAGVFGTADDLGRYLQTLLDSRNGLGRRFLSRAMVDSMLKAHPVPGSSTKRGLGWDLISPYSRVFSNSFPAGSFGHTGYTGTAVWVDPTSETFLIILTSRLHPNGRGNVKPLRARAAAAVAQGLGLGPGATAGLILEENPEEAVTTGASDTPDRMQAGVDVLAAQKFAALKGKKVGVITNHSGRDAAGRSLVTLLQQAPGVQLKAIFSPEHGMSGTLDEHIASGRDGVTGLPVYSLYGTVKKPTPAMLAGLDTLVYDLQDVGVRFYTYITTLGYCLEAAAAHGLEVVVLDRPNPITAAAVQGPVLEPGLKSFIGYFPLPVRYGMTPGELAQMFNRENHIGARLTVIPMKGYRRDLWYDETGLKWVNPSPNLRSLTQTVLYPGVGLVEAANVSVGRGTATPFEVLGAPYINGEELARYLEARRLAGVRLTPVSFTPKASKFRGRLCRGVRLTVTDRQALDSPGLGLELLAALLRLYPKQFELGSTLGMVGSREVVAALRRGEDPREIQRRTAPGLEGFKRLRERYKLY